MSWVRLDDQWADHPKFVGVGDPGQLLWVKGLTFAARYLTDGHLTHAVVDRLMANSKTARALAQKLVDARLWETTEAGYLIHDYHHYQPLAGDVKARRLANSERMKRVRGGECADERRTNDARTNTVRASNVHDVVRARASAGHGSGIGNQTATAETKPTDNDNGSAREALSPEEATRIRVLSKSDRPAKAESDYDLAKRVWVELWSAKYGEQYIFRPSSGPGSEDYALQRLGRAAKAASGGRTEQTLRHWVKSFLRDSGGRNWLIDNRHPLLSIERDLNKYGLPKTKVVPVNKMSAIGDEKEVPLSMEEQKKRAESLAGLVGKIGVGR